MKRNYGMSKEELENYTEMLPYYGDDQARRKTKYINIGNTPANKVYPQAHGNEKIAFVINKFDNMSPTGAKVVQTRNINRAGRNCVEFQFNYEHGIDHSGNVGRAKYEPNSPNTVIVY